MATEEEPSLDSLCYNLSSLLQLARQGSWRALIEAVADARKLSIPLLPHEQLVHHTYLVLSHLKLRSFVDASFEMDALADLDDVRYRYEHYPDLYPHRTGSMVPFVLRWLHAELPYYMNQPDETLERLYALYDHCQQRKDQLCASASDETANVAEKLFENSRSAPSQQAMDSTLAEQHITETDFSLPVHDNVQPTGELDTDFGDFVSSTSAPLDDLKGSIEPAQGIHKTESSLPQTWQQRQIFIINCIMSHHLNRKDYLPVLSWFKKLSKTCPSEPWLLSRLGYMQMQMGDLTGANYTFSEAKNVISKSVAENSENEFALRGLDYRNRGLQHMVRKRYNEAVEEFDSAIAVNPLDIISANNKALCYMYNRDLIGSTKILESILDKSPHTALNESLVLNLCSMYELAFVHNAQTKKNLSDWIKQIAPGDFDFSCTRL